jgi:hypothetical protein
MLRTAAILAARFFVLALIYLAVVAVWLTYGPGGWKGLAFFAMCIIMGMAGVLAWAAAVTIEQYWMAHSRLRLLSHPAWVTLFFLSLCFMIVDEFRSEAPEFRWREVAPFTGVVAAGAVADALLGFLLERWKPPQSTSAV